MSAWGSNSAARSSAPLIARVKENDPTLSSLLILPLKNFTSDDAVSLAAALADNSNLTEINCRGKTINDDSLKSLGCAIGNSSTIQSIAIGGSSMGTSGLHSLCCHGLLESKSVGRIDLGFKSITSSANESESEMLIEVGTALGSISSLRELILHRNEGLKSVGLSHLFKSGFSSLRIVDLSECEIDGIGLESFSTWLCSRGDDDNENALNLILNDNPLKIVTPLALPLQKNLIKSLQLKNCGLGDNGIKAIFDNAAGTVQEIDVEGNNVTAVGAECIGDFLKAGGGAVESIVLGNNPLTTAGIQFIADGLVSSGKKLQKLDLSRTDLKTKGATVILGTNVNVVQLRLFANNLGKEGIAACGVVINNNYITNLDLGGNESSEEGVLELLLNFRQPTAQKVLELGGNKCSDQVHSLLNEIALTNPELDVARDIPERNQSGNVVSGGTGSFSNGDTINMSEVNATMKAAGWKIG